MKITIFGAGAIGGIVGAHLIQSGQDVCFVEVNEQHRDAIRTCGLRVSGTADFLVHPEVLAPDAMTAPLDTVYLAVKARHTLDAMRVIAPRLEPEGYVLSLQNGFEEYKIADSVGSRRTVGAFLTFGGHYERPGEVVYGGPGTLKVGELDGARSTRALDIARTLSIFHPAAVTDNIFGCLWGKEALSSFYFATALVDADVPEMVERLDYRPTFSRLVGEVVTVARAYGVNCEPVDGFDPNQVCDEPYEAGVSWMRLLEYWTRHASRRTGIWRDLAVHHRPTEIDELLLPITERARATGLATPRLDCVIRLVHELEQGERVRGWRNLDELIRADHESLG